MKKMKKMKRMKKFKIKKEWGDRFFLVHKKEGEWVFRKSKPLPFSWEKVEGALYEKGCPRLWWWGVLKRKGDEVTFEVT